MSGRYEVPAEAEDVGVRLYGVPGAEHLHFDPADVYETDIEPWINETNLGSKWEIEEFSVKPPTEHLPCADYLLEWLVEWVGENGEVDEDAYAQWVTASRNDHVIGAAQILLDTLGSRIKYRMADEHLRSLFITLNDQGEPLLDGEPLYVKAADQ